MVVRYFRVHKHGIRILCITRKISCKSPLFVGFSQVDMNEVKCPAFHHYVPLTPFGTSSFITWLFPAYV